MYSPLSAILAVTFLLMSGSLFAQWGPPGGGGSGITGKITGNVVDSTSGEIVEFATVALRFQDSSKDINGGITGDKGQFKITDVKPGKYDLLISFVGYKTKTISGIELTPRKPDYDLGVINLGGNAVLLDQIEVVGQAALIENKVDRIVYNAEQDATSQGGDATDVLRKVPMLSVDIEGNVSLRGSSQVRILLNGKPSGMFSNNVADALKMFPADQIKSVEVITTPGAKYDGEGTGGIINIVTKKKNVEGYSGSISGSVGTRQNRGSVNLNASKGRFGLNGSGGAYYSWPQNAPIEFLRTDRVGEGQRTFSQIGSSETSRLGFWGKAGAYYDINAYNSVNTSFFLRGYTFDRNGFQDAVISNPTLSLSELYRRATSGDQLRSGYDWNTDYTRTFKDSEKEFSIAVQVSGENSDDANIIDQTSENSAFTNREKQDNDGLNLETTFQVDYTHPISEKVKWEVGGKGVLRNIDSDYKYDVFDPDFSEFRRDGARSNFFNYKQDVYAGYSSFTVQLPKDYTMIAGLRYERTSIIGDFEGGGDQFKNEYDNLLPSFILSKKIGFKTLKASFVRRIQRPSINFINPFVNSADPLNISFGNPGLAPEIANQVDLGYTSFNRGTVLATSLYYRRTSDVIQSLLSVREGGISATSFENIGLNNTVGANVFTSFTLKSFWTVRSNVDAGYFEINSNDSRNLSNNGMIYKLFVSSNFNFKKSGLKADIFGFYNSPRFTLQGRVPSFSMMSFGVSKEIWNKRGSVGINVVEPFFENKSFESELEGDDFYQYSNVQVPFRSFGINFSYRFGKLDFKAKERRSKIRNTDLKDGGDGNQGGGAPQGNGN